MWNVIDVIYYLDFRKSVDSVPRKGLFEKIRACGKKKELSIFGCTIFYGMIGAGGLLMNDEMSSFQCVNRDAPRDSGL